MLIRVIEARSDTCTIGDMNVHATYQVRAYTTAKGYARLERVMRMCALLYNAALREWRDAYRQAGVSRSLADQFKELTLVRRDDPSGWGSLSVQVGRGVLMRLDRSRRAFYRRVERGETPGYPRFRTYSRWRTIELAEPARGMGTPGREFVRVDLNHTNVMCSECGVADSSAHGRKRFECPQCGNSMAADINSAINILQKARAGGTSPPTTPESSKLCAV